MPLRSAKRGPAASPPRGADDPPPRRGEASARSGALIAHATRAMAGSPRRGAAQASTVVQGAGRDLS